MLIKITLTFAIKIKTPLYLMKKKSEPKISSYCLNAFHEKYDDLKKTEKLKKCRITFHNVSRDLNPCAINLICKSQFHKIYISKGFPNELQ
jgi:hypothetical protein